jgi:hypothetical protein
MHDEDDPIVPPIVTVSALIVFAWACLIGGGALILIALTRLFGHVF